jgi:hypothetical protein
MAASGYNADEGLQKGFNNSKACWIGMLGRDPVCCFGVAPYSVLGDKGSPWMLGTDGIKDREASRCVRLLSRYYIEKMLECFPILENYVDARNTISIKWLKWCGFNFDEAKPFGINKELFYRFWMTKEGFYV